MSTPITPWPRMIALVDMNAFFASIEQRDHPEWRGRPVAVTNGAQGTCIITCSYEARAYGIKTGMRLRQARQLCPDLIQCPAHPERYAEASTRIMEALTLVSPVMEVFSVDEAFLDLTPVQHLYGSVEDIGRMIKRIVFQASGLLCSVGLSGDKTTAKYAAKLEKPDGLTVIPPWESENRLSGVPVTGLCGIAEGVGRYLAARGVHVCGDMKKLPISALSQRFGNVGRRMWLMAQGLDPAPLETVVPDPKSIGHGKVMPPNTRDPEVVRIYLQHMGHKVGARLRRHGFKAQRFFIGLRTDHGWLGGAYFTALPTQDSRDIAALCQRMLIECWRGEGIHQVQLTATDPQSDKQTLLFQDAHQQKREALNLTMDRINARYGEFTLAPAPLLQRSAMPNVIAPAWKPSGHRQTI
ncbi:MAG: DNA polymerase Y family protein [Pseudomonadota bacterium]